jgi:hypothetical protein
MNEMAERCRTSRYRQYDDMCFSPLDPGYHCQIQAGAGSLGSVYVHQTAAGHSCLAEIMSQHSDSDGDDNRGQAICRIRVSTLLWPGRGKRGRGRVASVRALVDQARGVPWKVADHQTIAGRKRV